MEGRQLVSPSGPRQGDVYISDPSPLTGERELYVIVTSDTYSDAQPPTHLVAEIETGTRYRASTYATQTDFGVVLADRIVYYPIDMLGEQFGRLPIEQLQQVILQVTRLITTG